MKIQTISICLLTVLMGVGCSIEAGPKQSDAIAEEPAPGVSYPNLLKAEAFKQRNAHLLSPSNDRYVDSDPTRFVAVRAGTYTSKRRTALRVCAELKTNGANPAITVRGKAANTNLTAMLTNNNTKVNLRKRGGIGKAKLSNDRLCITSAVLPAGSTLDVFLYPAMSTDSTKYEESAVGDLKIKKLSVAWIDITQ